MEKAQRFHCANCGCVIFGVVCAPDGDSVRLSCLGRDRVSATEFKLLTDSQNPSISSFFGMIPLALMYHDSSINPRSIADLEPMIEELYNGCPQLQPGLAHLEFGGHEGRGRIFLFDAQHEAAAQLFNSRDRLPVRVFVNSDLVKQINIREGESVSS